MSDLVVQRLPSSTVGEAGWGLVMVAGANGEEVGVELMTRCSVRVSVIVMVTVAVTVAMAGSASGGGISWIKAVSMPLG